MMYHDKHENRRAARIQAQRDNTAEELVMAETAITYDIGRFRSGELTEPELVLKIVRTIAEQRNRAVQILLTKYLGAQECVFSSTF